MRNRCSSNSSGPTTSPEVESMDRLIFNEQRMTEQELDQAPKDARAASKFFQIRYENGKTNPNYFLEGEESNDLEFKRDISSSTEVEPLFENRKKRNEFRRSKCLTRGNPIVRLIKPVAHDFRREVPWTD